MSYPPPYPQQQPYAQPATPPAAPPPPEAGGQMSGSRVFWVAWCCFWALFWLLCGFITFGLAWIMVPVSLLALLIPVGARRPAVSPQAAVQRPAIPSSPYDPRFSDEEKARYFGRGLREAGPGR